MKNFLFILLALAAAIGCNSQKSIVASDKHGAKSVVKNDTVRIANDSLQYEVVIIDAGFTSWLAGRAYPRNYYSQSYLETKNRLWVSEWNIRATNPLQYRDLYDMRIDYDSNINYGYEVNYLIYNYLVYFQNKFGQRLGGAIPDR